MIVAKGISKSYHGRGDIKALENLSFTIGQGGVFTLLGRNGAGKTTTVKILSTILKRDSGYLSVFGFDPSTSPEEIRRRISIVPQDGKPIEYLTPRESIYFYLRMRGFSVEDSKRRAEIALNDFLMDKFSNQRCHSLSVGQKQMVLVAMALASDSSLVFLDEPTIGLDPVARQRVWKKISEAKEKTTIFLTTHYMEEAEILSDVVLIIKDGKSLIQGTPKELIDQFGYTHKITVKNYGNGFSAYSYTFKRKINDSLVVFLRDSELNEAVQQFVKEGMEISVGKVTLEDVFVSMVEGNDEE